ncbi:MAG: DoxX family protein [Pseudomonadota bacterium]
MNALVRLHDAIFDPLDREDWILPTLARFVFAAVFLIYFWNSAMTKLGGSISGLFSPSFNAFAQILPKGAEAVSYDITQASLFQKAVILAGTWAEFILPALIVIGLLTRLAAIGMIGFVIVQSLTDIYGHNTAVGAWFDNLADGVILDQRAMWILLLLILVFKGPGPISVDRLLGGARPY